MTSPAHPALVPFDPDLTSAGILANKSSLKRKRPGTMESASVVYNLDWRRSEEPQSLNGMAKLDTDRSLSAPPYSIVPSPHPQKSKEPGNHQKIGTSISDPIEIESSDDEEFIEYDPFYNTLRVTSM